MNNLQNRIIQQDQDPFTIVPNDIILEPTLSCSAKVIWIYLRMRPVDWTFYNREIVKHFKMGEEKLLKCFKELESFGLISRNQTRASSGQFSVYNFQVFRAINRPNLGITGSPPQGEKPDPVLPDPVNQGLQRKKETNKDITNISSLENQVKKEIKRREDFEKLDKGFKVDNFVQWLEDQGDNLKTTWKGALTSWSKRPENFDRQVVITQEKKNKDCALAVSSKIIQIKGSFEFKNKVGGFDIDEIDFKSLKFDRGAYFYYYNDKFPIDKYKSFFKALKINLKK